LKTFGTPAQQLWLGSHSGSEHTRKDWQGIKLVRASGHVMAPFEGHTLKTKNINPKTNTDRPIVFFSFSFLFFLFIYLFLNLLELKNSMLIY